MFKVNLETPERRQWCYSDDVSDVALVTGIIIVNFDYVSHIFLVFVMLLLNR